MGPLSGLIHRDSFPWQMTTSDHIRQFIADLPEIRSSNPLICAIEMALMDALGHAQLKPVTAFFPIRHGAGTIRYGASITVDDDHRIDDICRRLRTMGIRQVRIQMDTDLAGNMKRMAAVENAVGGDCELLIDPAGSWTGEIAMAHLPMIRHAPVRVVAEPMPLHDTHFKVFADEVATMGVRLMVCNSCATQSDIRHLLGATPYRLVDIELSRNGGFHRALQIIDMLRDLGIDYQISNRREEAGILSAASRTLNLVCGDARYRDGARELLDASTLLTTRKTGVGPGGEVGPLTGAGLGVRVDHRRLERFRKGPAVVFHNPDPIRIQQRQRPLRDAPPSNEKSGMLTPPRTAVTRPMPIAAS